MKKLIPWESSCFSISLEFFVVWLVYSDEELLAAKGNRFAVNRTFFGRRFAGCLPFFRVGQGGVLERLTYRRSASGGGTGPEGGYANSKSKKKMSEKSKKSDSGKIYHFE